MVYGRKRRRDHQQVTEQSNNTYSIYGENFTKQSKVFINGEKQNTTFLNNTRLDLKESELADGDTIMVAQVGIEQYDVSDDRRRISTTPER